jgi:hypothetical protein
MEVDVCPPLVSRLTNLKFSQYAAYVKPGGINMAETAGDDF